MKASQVLRRWASTQMPPLGLAVRGERSIHENSQREQIPADLTLERRISPKMVRNTSLKARMRWTLET